MKFVWRQLESAFFGALTLVGASFVFTEKIILEVKTLGKFLLGLGKFLWGVVKFLLTVFAVAIVSLLVIDNM